MTLTAGTLLDGRVRYAQPASGFRSGIEPVLLAAAVPACEGDSVLEGGTGAGAGLLCLLHRLPLLHAVGIERDQKLAMIAHENLAANGMVLRARITVADVLGTEEPGPFDHAFANPPYHHPSAPASPDAMRRAAKQTDALGGWTASIATRLRARGTLTMILPAWRVPEALAAFKAARLGSLTLFPLWPRAGEPAKLILLQGTLLGRGPTRLLSGLALHVAGSNRFTEVADAILREGRPLPLGR